MQVDGTMITINGAHFDDVFDRSRIEGSIRQHHVKILRAKINRLLQEQKIRIAHRDRYVNLRRSSGIEQQWVSVGFELSPECPVTGPRVYFNKVHKDDLEFVQYVLRMVKNWHDWQATSTMETNLQNMGLV